MQSKQQSEAKDFQEQIAVKDLYWKVVMLMSSTTSTAAISYMCSATQYTT
jgi:hypothetical protein